MLLVDELTIALLKSFMLECNSKKIKDFSSSPLFPYRLAQQSASFINFLHTFSRVRLEVGRVFYFLVIEIATNFPNEDPIPCIILYFAF